MCISLTGQRESLTYSGKSNREKNLQFQEPLKATIEPYLIKLPLERRSISLYDDEKMRSAWFFRELDSIPSSEPTELLPKIKSLSKEIFRLSLGVPKGTFKFRLNHALWQTLNQIKEDLKKTKLKDTKSLRKLENFLETQIKNTNYPSIFTENYILGSIRDLIKSAKDTSIEFFSLTFINEFYYIRELLIRFTESLKYHNPAEKAVICHHFSENFFREYGNLFSELKKAPLPLNKEEVSEKIKRKILKMKKRSELKTLQIDILRLALLTINQEASKEECFNVFDAEVKKLDLLLNPPLSVIEELIKNLQISWLTIKKLPRREIPITFFEASIRRINDYFIKNSTPLPKKFLFLQIDISNAGKILRQRVRFIT
jgi:hypothetical protein